jgi:sporulation protein YqfC
MCLYIKWKGKKFFMKNKRRYEINKILEIPTEIISTIPKLTSLGFEKLMIENYKNILEYEEHFIRVSTSIGIINIDGINMKMEEMTKDDIIIEGSIESINFEKNEE